jgi:hypothetical protein
MDVKGGMLQQRNIYQHNALDGALLYQVSGSGEQSLGNELNEEKGRPMAL